MAEIRVYASYAWKVEEQTKIGRDLEELKELPIDELTNDFIVYFDGL